MTTWHTTGVGSLPFQSSSDAIGYIFKSYTIPFYPQLVKNERYLKNSLPQMLQEAVPAYVLTLFLEKSKAIETPSELNKIWKNELPRHLESLPAINEFADALSKFQGKFYKIQVLGPCSAIQLLETVSGLKLQDSIKSIVHAQLQQLASMMIDKCKSSSKQAIFIFDEPFGLNVDVINSLEVGGSLVGVHSCKGFPQINQVNLLKSKYISFDLNQVGCSKSLYQVINQIILNGGMMLGLVDTTQDTVNALNSFQAWQQVKQNILIEAYSKISMPPILTAACGTGSKSINFEKQLSVLLRKLSQS